MPWPGLLVYVMGVMGYYWLMVNLFPIAQAALATAIQWGLAGTGGTSLTVEMIQKPSFIMTEGLKAAYPMADQASWFERIWASVKMVNKPGEMVAYWFVVLAFLAITAHHMMMLIEYHLSVMCAAVLIPWGLWSATASVGEFAVGWLTGGFIRALVSTAMLGIALPLFGLLNKPAEGFITLYNTVMLDGRLVHFCCAGLGDSRPRGQHRQSGHVPGRPWGHGDRGSDELCPLWHDGAGGRGRRHSGAFAHDGGPPDGAGRAITRKETDGCNTKTPSGRYGRRDESWSN